MNGVKVKLDLIEYYYCCFVFPIAGIVFATILLIWELFTIEIDLKFINGIIIIYICSIFLFIINFIICSLFSKYTNKFAIFYEDYFLINETKETYNYKDIVKCKYYICKWYFIPFWYIYKMQYGGQFEIITTTDKKIVFKILYKDFKKIKNRFHSIEIL